MLFNCQLDLNYYNFNESIMEKFKKTESDHILSDGRDQNVARQDKSDAGFDIIN